MYLEIAHSHKLFVFMTHHLGSCYRFAQRKENGQWRALLTIYGDQARNQTAFRQDIDEAKDICIKYYVIFLIKENIMTWDYLPGQNFENYKHLIQKTLQPG
ncbi:hypothetical protein DAPPUDRAFT_323674 [Daphnia pulex]|uniref:Uncharacterized protein n=1 Tax=Daphnia pulex TaxID=6669 RepID=E9GZF6_DAPPU|nr:hypothetical protein DAPPUDRAFT_323674 [Daphnia pulex]|eukprot:EFX75167.1 hypothetical protein DAPPUDRAFT_323674 [Daphnia pulex]